MGVLMGDAPSASPKHLNLCPEIKSDSGSGPVLRTEIDSLFSRLTKTMRRVFTKDSMIQ